MVVTCVEVHVKPEHVEDFIRASKINHEKSVEEPANVRFDVLQSEDDPTRFLLYEFYESEEGAMEHKKTAHYGTWRATVEPWMAEARKGVPYRVIAP